VREHGKRGHTGKQSRGGATTIFRRLSEPKGPLTVFGYHYFESRAEAAGIPTPRLLRYQGEWGSGEEYAYEALNFADGTRTAQQIDAEVSAEYGPIPTGLVIEYMEALRKIGVGQYLRAAVRYQSMAAGPRLQPGAPIGLRRAEPGTAVTRRQATFRALSGLGRTCRRQRADIVGGQWLAGDSPVAALDLLNHRPRDGPHRFTFDLDHRVGKVADDPTFLVSGKDTFDDLHIDEWHADLLHVAVVDIRSRFPRAPLRCTGRSLWKLF
jgi:hypothetical protein